MPIVVPVTGGLWGTVLVVNTPGFVQGFVVVVGNGSVVVVVCIISIVTVVVESSTGVVIDGLVVIDTLGVVGSVVDAGIEGGGPRVDGGIVAGGIVTEGIVVVEFVVDVGTIDEEGGAVDLCGGACPGPAFGAIISTSAIISVNTAIMPIPLATCFIASTSFIIIMTKSHHSNSFS